MGWKPHKLEGCRGLNNFFTRLGVITKILSGMTPMSPGCTPTGEVMKGLFNHNQRTTKISFYQATLSFHYFIIVFQSSVNIIIRNVKQCEHI